MTRETNGIRAAFASSGLAGMMTDINTPGVHGTGSFHYKAGTAGQPIDAMDFAQGKKGLAEDFAFRPRQVLTPGLLAIFNFFAEHYGPQLTELFHSGAPYFIKYGRRYPIAQLDTVDYNNHKDHVHVAVAKGTILQPLASPPVVIAAPEAKRMTLVIEPAGAVAHPVIRGAYWEFGKRGHVYAKDGAPAFNPNGWDDATRNDLGRSCVALVPTKDGNGYWLVSNYGELYQFGNAPQIDNYDAKRFGAGAITGALPNDNVPGLGGVTFIRDDGRDLNPFAYPL